MNFFLRFLICVFCSWIFLVGKGQTIEPSILQRQWRAFWITVPGEPANAYGVYLFRKTIELSSKPASFVIHVSADNRYKLFINETLVSLGPARGDIAHWNYETVDIAPFLHAGKNTIGAIVWNEAEWRPEAQISLRTGFILQGAGAAEQLVNTNASWKCIRDDSYQPLRVRLSTYYVSGPGEQIDMRVHIKNWEGPGYVDTAWTRAQPIFPGSPKNMLGEYGVNSGWFLVPSDIPPMETIRQRLLQVRKSESVTIPPSFPASKTTITVPGNTRATILLDQTFLTNAYPTLIFSGGRDGTVSLSYAESLYTKYPAKGNRNEIEGKHFIGRKDSIISDGSNGQSFTSLAWRTYRYIHVQVITKEEPLVIDDFYGTFTGYPFEYKARLESENKELNELLETGWRTARLCAGEIYMDCPYYEQLQYIGDTRIQGMVSLYNSGDDRLFRNALNQMDHSRQPEGVTLSRHPSYSPQFIPTFSLLYIGMLHDYWMYGRDSNFIKNKLPGERQVLNYFRSYQQSDGSLVNVPYWMFTDWVVSKGWAQGVGPKGSDGASALIDLQLLMAYQLAAGMENKIGIKAYADLYNQYAEQLKKTIRAKYWDEGKNLFADRLEKDLFSQHANSLAILTGIVPKKDVAKIATKLLTDTTLAPASIYFKYYLHQALVKAGFGNDYLNWLGKWRENKAMGLTTWAETSQINTSRSDCHAWGASPNIELFRTVMGIDSDAPGFTKIKIEPHLGTLRNISAEMPHPNGKISVQYAHENNAWAIEIVLPDKTTGSFIWKGKTYLLREGKNSLRL